MAEFVKCDVEGCGKESRNERYQIPPGWTRLQRRPKADELDELARRLDTSSESLREAMLVLTDERLVCDAHELPAFVPYDDHDIEVLREKLRPVIVNL